MKISVVVPTYNRRALLEKCLDALLDQSISQNNYEVIVVDDCSSDDTRDYLEERTQQTINLRFIRHSINQGRVSTRNDGIRETQGEIVIFLDNDNVPNHDFVEAHQRYHENYFNEHIAVMGNVRFEEGTIAGSNFGRYIQSRNLGCRKAKELNKINLSNLPPQYFGGSNSSVRREDLFAVGLFDTRFRHYGGEDEIMGYCLKKAGLRILYGEEAMTTHFDEVSISRYQSKYEEAGREGLWVIITNYPDYIRTQKVNYLLPVDYSHDKLSLVIVKNVVRGLLNPVALSILKKWAVATDRYRWAFWPIVYRLLLAGSILKGVRSNQRGFGRVSYT
jgi:glycosyltransferase involved in cell wall biosynthesis